MKPLRIGIDLRMAHNTGIGRYARCLLPELTRRHSDVEWIGILNPGQEPDWFPPELKPFMLAELVPVYSIREYASLGGMVEPAGLDILHVPHFNIPRRVPAKLVVTIHDLIYLQFPEEAKTRFHGWVAGNRIGRAVRQSAHVLTVSDFSRREILRRFPVPEHHVTAVPHGHEHMLIPPSPERPAGVPEGTYLLYVGNHLPHKNLGFLIDVFAQVRSAVPGLRLLLAGPKGRHTPLVEGRIHAQGLDASVIFVDGADDADLAWLYRNAALLVHPSLGEGFGFPVLEAMAVGTPVVCSNGTSLPEVAGDGAVLLPPDDPMSWRETLTGLLRDGGRRADLARRGRERAARFTWAESARKTWDVYEKVARASGRNT